VKGVPVKLGDTDVGLGVHVDGSEPEQVSVTELPYPLSDFTVPLKVAVCVGKTDNGLFETAIWKSAVGARLYSQMPRP
jgi:hypothetical protein